MNQLFLVTGADGHLGTILTAKLKERGEIVRPLIFSGQAKGAKDSDGRFYGDITDPESIRCFFDHDGYDSVTLIHCASIITIASGVNPRVWKVNVEGTRNVMEYAFSSGVDRVIYVSSVHAIPEKPKGEIISETDHFSPEPLHGQYAKSKAAATQIVLDYAKKGLNASIVHPSGIIGPGDVLQRNYIVRSIRDMASGKIPVAVQGGYDFVDSRDVADGILGCERFGKKGECYILNGHYITLSDLLNTVRKMAGKKETHVELSCRFARRIAPLAEKLSLMRGNPVPAFTPYSVWTLQTNACFSHRKAEEAFGYRPRDIVESIQASL